MQVTRTAPGTEGSAASSWGSIPGTEPGRAFRERRGRRGPRLPRGGGGAAVSQCLCAQTSEAFVEEEALQGPPRRALGGEVRKALGQGEGEGERGEEGLAARERFDRAHAVRVPVVHDREVLLRPAPRLRGFPRAQAQLVAALRQLRPMAC